MSYNPLNIILGITLLFAIGYGLILLYSYLYLRFMAREQKINLGKISISTITMTFFWLLTIFLAIWFAASLSVILFGLFALVIFFGIIFTLVGKLYGVAGRHKLFFSIALAVFLNPLWFVLFNII